MAEIPTCASCAVLRAALTRHIAAIHDLVEKFGYLPHATAILDRHAVYLPSTQKTPVSPADAELTAVLRARG